MEDRSHDPTGPEFISGATSMGARERSRLPRGGAGDTSQLHREAEAPGMDGEKGQVSVKSSAHVWGVCFLKSCLGSLNCPRRLSRK